MEISVSSYSFQALINAGTITQEETLLEAQKLGFRYIEFTDLTPCENYSYEDQVESAKRIRKNADALGIKVNAYTIGASLYQETEEARKDEVERIKKQLDIAKILGAPVLRHDACWQLGKTGNSRSFDLMLPTIAKSAGEITEYAQTLGIRTCTENHGYIAQDSDRMERLFNAVAHDNYGLLVDMGNFVCADEPSAHGVSKLAPYAVHVHAKDMRVLPGDSGAQGGMTRGGNIFQGTVIGEGQVPIRQCLRILKQAGYDGIVSIEYEAGGDCLDGIKRGKENLERYIKELS